MNGILLSVLGFGFVLGLKHALDPDHIVAVSAIVSESKSVKRSSLVGTFWGLGHTLSLLLAGIVVIVLKVQISDRVALWMEFAVALMLIVLGLRAMITLLRGWKLHRHRHTHDGSTHTHLHLHRSGEEQRHQHLHLIGIGARPLLVGMVHGIAGSAALTLLVLTTIPSAVAGLIYIIVFGIGSVGGMLIVSSLIGLPFVLTPKPFRLLNEGLQAAVGLFSLTFGLFLAWQYCFHDHLIF
jgi:high-affinity nickel permease